MDMSKRSLFFGGVSLLISGCMTSKLYESKRRVELVSYLLISDDGKYVVYMGSDYHYVFEAPHELIALLASDVRGKVQVRQSELFRIQRSGDVLGELIVETTSKIKTYEEAKKAESIGFVFDDFSYFLDEGVRKKMDSRWNYPSGRMVLHMKGKIYV